jgi:hypothetical protein
MKFFLLAVLITVILSLSTICLFAQEDKEPVRVKKTSWLPENGYWVIESTLSQPKNSIVHFYNNEDKEVYREAINGIILNLQKRKYRKQLKIMLDKAINAWARKEPLTPNENFLIAGLRK